MAFSVVGRWGEEGVTVIRVSDFDRYQQGWKLELQQF